jgi:mono/diheme cytochrome c family protein
VHRLLCVLTLTWLLLAEPAFSADTSQVERGRYLTEEVAKCQDCHTPHLASGEADRSHWMKGATLGFKPIVDIAVWQKSAPDLTSSGALWSSWGESTMVKFMTTGLGPGGKSALPPMPAYKLNPADAQAIVVYLKSLK